MTKQEYLVYRDMEEPCILMYYEYYLEHKKGELVTLPDFGKYFPEFLVHFEGKVMILPTGTKYISFERILEKIYSYFNKKFEC